MGPEQIPYCPAFECHSGVAEVASVGGMPMEYQVDIQPERLRAYGVTLGELYEGISKSNSPAGGGVIQKNNAEYIVRGIGWIKSKEDIENTVIREVDGIPIYVKTIATVQLGTRFRRGVFEKTDPRWSAGWSSCVMAKTRWPSPNGSRKGSGN